jgi:hypothetical protein
MHYVVLETMNVMPGKKKGHKTTYIYHDSQASECVDAEEVRGRTPHACKKQRARPKNNYMEPPQIKS